VVVLGSFLVGPTGERAVLGTEGFVATVPGSGPVMNAVIPDAGSGRSPGAYILNGDSMAYQYITVLGWLNANSVLVGIANYGSDPADLFSMTLPRSGDADVKPVDLVPTNTKTNHNAVASPDGTTIAFLGTQGSVTQLYTTTTTGKAQPTSIGSDFSGTLLTWQ